MKSKFNQKTTKVLLTLTLLGLFQTGCNNKGTNPTSQNDSSEIIEQNGPYLFKHTNSKGIVAKILGDEITDSHFRKGIENELYEAEQKLHELQMARIKQIILEKLIEKDPRKKDLSPEAFLEQYVTNVATPTAEEIEKFIVERDVPKDLINDQLKQRIKDFLFKIAQNKAQDAWANDQLKDKPVDIYLNKPKQPVFEVAVGDSPTMGSESAKVTIVEFADFECHYCNQAAKLVNQVKEKYGEKIRVVFKNFPLPFHKQAQKASEAALCAEKQQKGMFWQMHDLLFKNQDKLAEEHLKEFAKSLKLNSQDFDLCIKNGEFKKSIEADIEQGEKIGIESTPTFLINGRMVKGVLPEEVNEIIERELAPK